MKSSGSVWFGYGVAVVVTLVVGLLAFSVFVLSKVFGSSDASQSPPQVETTAQVEPPAPPASTPAARTAAVQVLEVRPVTKDPRQVVLIVATQAGCARELRAAAYAEGPGAVAVRVTQQAYKTGCRWQRRPVLATAKAPIADRTLLVNGTLWTSVAGRYQPALRTTS